jgi:hypothetical protein
MDAGGRRSQDTATGLSRVWEAVLIWISSGASHVIYCSRDECGVQNFLSAKG